MFIDNDWWGHKYVLAKYCAVKENPIFGSMQHGVYSLEQEINWNINKKRNFDFIPFFCNSNFFFQKCKNNNVKNIIPIGSVFLYLDKLIKYSKKKKGTIVFPAHSGFTKEKKIITEKYLKKKREFDHIGFIKNVEKYNKPPFIVSIIKDDLNDISHFYNRKNWKIFSAGNRYDKLFLFNIYKLISQNTHAVFCELTSALYYSMYLGLKVRIAVKSYSKKNIKLFSRDIFKSDQITFKSYIKKYPEIFFGNLSRCKAKEIAKERMGFDCLRSKAELREILGWNSKIKIFFSIILKKIYNYKYQFKK